MLLIVYWTLIKPASNGVVGHCYIVVLSAIKHPLMVFAYVDWSLIDFLPYNLSFRCDRKAVLRICLNAYQAAKKGDKSFHDSILFLAKFS